MAKEEKRLPLTDECIGQTLSRDVMFKDNFTVLVAKYSRISQYIHKRLKDLGIQEVYIWVEKDNKVSSTLKMDDLANKQYVGANKLKKVFNDVLNADKIDTEEIGKICGEIKVSNKHKNVVFQFMSDIKIAGDHIYTHSVNVSVLAGLFGEWLGLGENEVQNLMLAGLVHDIGKTLISEDLHNKQDLTQEELLEMQTHTTKGYEFLKKADIPEEVRLATLMHHERIGGGGYPNKIVNVNDIHYFARAIAILDIFDESSHQRVYKKDVLSPFSVFKIFREDLFGLLDMELLEVFMLNVAYMYSGARCRLSDGSLGEIVFVNPVQIQRPMVRVGQNIVDLNTRRDLFVERVYLT